MNTDKLLEMATTSELIALVDSVEGKILFSLSQGDRAHDRRLQSSHRAATEAFTEQLRVVLLCLQIRADDDMDAAIFLAEVDAGEHTFLMAG